MIVFQVMLYEDIVRLGVRVGCVAVYVHRCPALCVLMLWWPWHQLAVHPLHCALMCTAYHFLLVL